MWLFNVLLRWLQIFSMWIKQRSNTAVLKSSTKSQAVCQPWGSHMAIRTLQTQFLFNQYDIKSRDHLIKDLDLTQWKYMQASNDDHQKKKKNAIHFTPKMLQYNWHKQVVQFMVTEVLTIRGRKKIANLINFILLFPTIPYVKL